MNPSDDNKFSIGNYSVADYTRDCQRQLQERIAHLESIVPVTLEAVGESTVNQEDLKAFREAMNSMQEGYRSKYLNYEGARRGVLEAYDALPLPPTLPPPPVIKPKVKKLIPCPEHGNPMVRKKGDDDHLYCTVVGCTKVLKRKVPLEPSEADKNFAGPIEDVVPELLKHVEPEPEVKDSEDVEQVFVFDYLRGYRKDEAYVACSAPVRIHRTPGRYFLVQQNPDGTESRIDITEGNILVDSRREAIHSFSSPHPEYITFARVTLDNILLE